MPVLAGLYRQQKPPFGNRIIDSSNSLSVGLLRAWFLNEYCSPVYDSARSSTATLNAGAWTIGRFGTGINLNGTSTQFLDAGNPTDLQNIPSGAGNGISIAIAIKR